MKTFNMLNYDDPIFPTTMPGMKAAGLVEQEDKEKDGGATGMVLESAGGNSQVRAQAMSAVLSWIADGDFSFNALDEYVMGVADLDGDFEIGKEEEDLYNQIFAAVPDAFLSIGATESNVMEFVNDENDDAGAKLGAFCASAMEDYGASDEDIIAAFAHGEDAVMESSVDEEGHMVLESTFKKMKMIRGGKLILGRKRISGKVRLSAAQKAGLKKARLKANNSAARLHRRKSMKIRKLHGM